MYSLAAASQIDSMVMGTQGPLERVGDFVIFIFESFLELKRGSFDLFISSSIIFPISKI